LLDNNIQTVDTFHRRNLTARAITARNFENRLIFGKVKAYKNGDIFGPPCRAMVLV